MKYLTLIPDYTQSCVRDNFDSAIDLDTLGLSSDLMLKLNDWHKRYRNIIPLGDSERRHKMLEIEALDKEGLSLAGELEQAVRGGAKVRYFSEGKLEFLS